MLNKICFFLTFILVALFTKCYALKILATEIDKKIKKEYKNLKSFSLEVEFDLESGENYKYILVENGKNVIFAWEGKDTYNTNDGSVIPINLDMFVNPYNFWRNIDIDTTKITYDYMDHIPCIVLGDTNKIYIDIEHYTVRKIIYSNSVYVFRDFMHIGNYYLPTKIEISCATMVLNGKITWEYINKNIEKEPIRGLNSVEPLIGCLPNFSKIFR